MCQTKKAQECLSNYTGNQANEIKQLILINLINFKLYQYPSFLFPIIIIFLQNVN